MLARLDRVNPVLNAFLTITADLALASAREAEGRFARGEPAGPLDGVPFSIKDLEPTAGIRTTFGSRWFAEHVPTADSAVAARARATGGALLGKTNTPHFGHKDMSDNLLGPPARNPWKPDRTPGGSSGGAVAAVAAGLGPIATGSDGGGSIRGPAALSGVFGIKPSFGRVSNYPSGDYWDARPASGPLSRTVRDAALLLQALAGFDPRDPLSLDSTPGDFLAACDGDLDGMRVVWSADFGYAPVDPEVREIAHRAALAFKDFGCEYEERDPGWDNPVAFYPVISGVAVYGRNAWRLAEHPDWLEPSFEAAIRNGEHRSVLEYQAALQARSNFYDRAMEFFSTCDLLLTPQYPLPAWSVDPDAPLPRIGDHQTTSMWDRLPFTVPFNLTGQPAASVPCGFTAEGLPVGLQIVGRPRQDALVLRAAACFEAARPWAGTRPRL